MLDSKVFYSYEEILDEGWSPERPSHDRKLGIFSPAPRSLEKGDGLEMECMSQQGLVTKPPRTPEVRGLESVQVSEHREVVGERCTQRQRESSAPLPMCLAWDVLDAHLYPIYTVL